MASAEIKLHKLHSAQQEIMNTSKRFNVLKCGRRFGKTDMSLELTIQPMLDGFPVGYWAPTYKDLSDVWDELKFILHYIIKSRSEQLKTLTLITGGKLDMWSLEDPNSGRGRHYKRVIIDEAEKARHLKDGWEQTIRATLIDLKGDAWFMSTPKFGQTYFKELFKNKDKHDNWQSWRYSTYDNPFMDKEEIDMAKAQLDDLTFRCEYMAEDVDVTLRPFAYSFDENKHVKPCSYDPNYELMLSFDFNVDPITCVVSQLVDDQLRFINEYKLSNSDIYNLCDAVIATYDVHNPVYLITGDASGKSRSALTIGNINYYTVIRQKFAVGGGQMKVPSSNRAISDSRVLMNSMFQNYDIIIDPSCVGLIYDLKYVQVDDKGAIEKDRSTEAKKADMLDCARYTLDTFFRWFLKSLIQADDYQEE